MGLFGWSTEEEIIERQIAKGKRFRVREDNEKRPTEKGAFFRILAGNNQDDRGKEKSR